MTMIAYAVALIRRGESSRLKVYDDATGRPVVKGSVLKGHPTIGIGRNLAGRGISREEEEFMLLNDLAENEKVARAFVGPGVWAELRPERQAVLMDLAHNLGPGLHKFVRLRAAIACSDWPSAVRSMLESKWATQVGRRATCLAGIMATGEMPADMLDLSS